MIVFDREFLTKVRIPANHSLWTVHDCSSFLASLTCSSIGDFEGFMLDFYQQRDRREIVSTIDTYGDDELDPTKLPGLRVREPAFDASLLTEGIIDELLRLTGFAVIEKKYFREDRSIFYGPKKSRILSSPGRPVGKASTKKSSSFLGF